MGGSPVGLLATLLSVCPCVCSLHKCMRFKQQLESTLHGTSGVGWLYFSSGPVQSVVAWPREKKPALKKALNLVESFKLSWWLYRG